MYRPLLRQLSLIRWNLLLISFAGGVVFAAPCFQDPLQVYGWWWILTRTGTIIAGSAVVICLHLVTERRLRYLKLRRSLRNRLPDRTVSEPTEELQASEARFALAVRGSSDGLWDWNLRTNEVYYLPRSKGMLDLRDKGFANTLDAFNESLHPDDFKRTWRALQLHIEQHEPYDIEHRLRTKSGEYRWFRSQGQAIWDKSGRAIRMAGSVTDIHRQKVAELALNHERFLLDTLLNNLPDAIYFKDTAGRFLRVSSSLQKHLGVNRPDEILGKTDADFFPSEYAIRAREDETELMQNGKSGVTKEEQPRWADGRSSWVLTTKIPLRNHQGQIVGTFGISRDISARKEAEQALIAAKEIAEAASRSKSEFLANMSHEIRTPMNSILGFTELLRRGSGSAEQQKFYLDTIHSSGRHLLTLIDDILDLSKIEAGQMEFECVRCCPHQIIGEVLSVLRVRAQEQCLSLECKWTSGVPETIQTDPARLRQLLINMVGNAIKFTECGNVRLQVNVAFDSPEPRMMIEVHDTGIGMSAEQIGRLFTPFKQADSSVTRRFGGTGLGLAISRHIVRQLGGDISVTSEPGRGSIFRISLRTGSLDNVRIFETPPNEALQPSHQRPSSQIEKLTSARILLVEDGESNRDLVSLVLREAGAIVETAENGQHGLVAAMRGGFDVILMDMQMPVMDGYTATRKLRESGITVPIVALTAHAMRDDEQRCLAAGCTGYLSKPIDIDRLVSTVHGLLKPNHKPSNTPVRGSKPAQHRPTITSTLPVEHDGFRNLVESFLVKLPDKLDAISAAIAADDVEGVEELAHWLRGTGGTMGFDCLTEPARQMESNARKGDASALSEHLQGIRDLADRLAVSD